jgi:hypothetical protein
MRRTAGVCLPLWWRCLLTMTADQARQAIDQTAVRAGWDHAACSAFGLAGGPELLPLLTPAPTSFQHPAGDKTLCRHDGETAALPPDCANYPASACSTAKTGRLHPASNKACCLGTWLGTWWWVTGSGFCQDAARNQQVVKFLTPMRIPQAQAVKERTISGRPANAGGCPCSAATPRDHTPAHRVCVTAVTGNCWPDSQVTNDCKAAHEPCPSIWPQTG